MFRETVLEQVGFMEKQEPAIGSILQKLLSLPILRFFLKKWNIELIIQINRCNVWTLCAWLIKNPIAVRRVLNIFKICIAVGRDVHWNGQIWNPCKTPWSNCSYIRQGQHHYSYMCLLSIPDSTCRSHFLIIIFLFKSCRMWVQQTTFFI